MLSRELEIARFESHDSQTARVLKKINLVWTLENFKLWLEIFNLDLENSPPPPHTKIGVWWVARLKCSVSLENVIRFNLLKFSISCPNPEFFQDLGPLGSESPDSRFKVADSVPLRSLPSAKETSPWNHLILPEKAWNDRFCLKISLSKSPWQEAKRQTCSEWMTEDSLGGNLGARKIGTGKRDHYEGGSCHWRNLWNL